MTARRFGSAPAVGVAAMLVAACNVGPTYERPPIAVPATFKEGAPGAYAGLPPGTWRPADPRDAALKGEWWRVFLDPELDALEAKLESGNQTIAQSFENFMAARAQVDVARAAYFPTVSVTPAVTASGGVARGSTGTIGFSNANPGAGTTTPGATYPGGGLSGASALGGSTTLYTIPVQASWAPDLWQRVANTVREYRYAAQVSAADLENVRLTEQSTLAVDYFELRGQDALADIFQRTIAADEKSLEYARGQRVTGIGTEETVAQAEVTLENARANAIGVATTRATLEHAIATLIGRPASGFVLPARPLATPVPAIPVGVPSQLLERRPDVAAAERTVAQANALIGVAKAAYYPSLDLDASGGLAAVALGTLFSLPSLFWSLGASAAETIFDGGQRGATVAQYKALYEADVAAYRQTVLTAFQQVEDQLSTMRILSQQIARQQTAMQAARRFVDLALAQYETGISPYLDVITAQGLLLTDQQTLLTLQVMQMTAAVQLIEALGGGWDTSQLPSASRVTSDAAARALSPR